MNLISIAAADARSPTDTVLPRKLEEFFFKVLLVTYDFWWYFIEQMVIFKMAATLLWDMEALFQLDFKYIGYVFTDTLSSGERLLDHGKCYIGLGFIRAHFLSLAQSKLRLCSANHRTGYLSKLAYDWLSIVWAYSEQETKNGRGLAGYIFIISVANSTVFFLTKIDCLVSK